MSTEADVGNDGGDVLSRMKVLLKDENGKNKALDLIREHGRRLKEEKAYKQLRDDYMKFAEELIVDEHSGSAADLISDVAKWFKMEGLPAEEIAGLYIWIATKLREKDLFGWAGSRYYYAAMAYVENGAIEKACEVLSDASEEFNKTPDEIWRGSLARHVAILKEPGVHESAKLATLLVDFRKESRNDWVKSCEDGMVKLRE